jgi:glycosyltransferase involved in cell wall biosynthesis
MEWQRYWPIRIYAAVVNHFLRQYDWESAQGVDEFVVNSENVRQRVRKFYGRNAEIVYPPVEVEKIMKNVECRMQNVGGKKKGLGDKSEKGDYFLIVSRVVGAKGIDMAMEAARRLKFELKIVGEPAGLRWEEDKLEKLRNDHIEFLGRVSDDELWQVYAGAKGFLAMAEDEDFGMTVVEAQAAGTPVVAYYGGGYKETVVDGKTGVFFKDYSVEGLIEGMRAFDKIAFKREDLVQQARRFSRGEFERGMRRVIRD